MSSLETKELEFARQVRRATRRSDDHFYAAIHGPFGILRGEIGRPMGGSYAIFHLDAE